MTETKDGHLYPIKLRSVVREKVWGGQRIARTFRPDLPAGRSIGEMWMVWGDLVVENGELAGRKLDDVMHEYPLSLLGSRLAGHEVPTFPLLVKILDAQETLSVQVHPDDAYAQEHEGEPFGKAEAWFILGADPGARLIHGVRRPVSRREMEQAIKDGVLEDRLEYVPVRAGDVICNPAGAIHALGGGLLLYELQQSSDLTYRLYDWDRRDPERPLHLSKSLDVAHLEPYSQHKTEPVSLPGAGGERKLLCAMRSFAAELLTVHSQMAAHPAGLCFHILTALEGSGRVCYNAEPCDSVALAAGASIVIPASSGEYRLQAGRHPWWRSGPGSPTCARMWSNRCASRVSLSKRSASLAEIPDIRIWDN